jgi:hypothetical protein
MIPVFETETFKREANKQGLGFFAAQLRELFKQNPDPDIHFNFRIDDCTWYKIKPKKGHIVGCIKDVEVSTKDKKQKVFCLLRLINFDSNDLKYIVGRQARKKVKKLHQVIDDEALHVFLKKWVREQKETIIKTISPQLPSKYQPWLQPPRWFPTGTLDPLGLVVYETEDWRKGMRTIEDHWAEVHTALQPFLWDDPNPESSCKELGANGYAVVTKRDIVIYCVYYNSLEGYNDRRLLMLLKNRDQNSKPVELDEENNEIKKIYHDLFKTTNGNNFINAKSWEPSQDKQSKNHYYPKWDSESGIVDLLARKSIRAYPGFYLDKNAYEAWKHIEADESANLAMSPEEEVLLTNLTRGDGESTSTPAFINGRAGSGKSTVLYYLFAHYWIYGRGRKDVLPGTPFFITLSGRLIDTARDIVKSIVEADCRYLPDYKSNENITIGLSDVFLPFRSILLDILPKYRHSSYPADKEINFSIFRRLLLCNNDTRIPTKHKFKGKLDRSCSAELCWHVIRSYIKGFSIQGLMDVGAYSRLPKEDKSVNASHFQSVFENVWPWYRSLTEEGVYWDQQDLAREVLIGLRKGDLKLPDQLNECVAVFCDEAQDLTGVELNIVLHLSIFSRYDLGDIYPLSNIPFAFAGDPLQTLNPSGFRWENLTSNFYRNLLTPLGLQRPVLKSELQYNYRSPQLITRLANLIQFYRRAIFHENYLKPQQPWSLSDGIPPTRFVIPETLTDSEIKSLQDSFFLLPCEEGLESEYAIRFPVLINLMKMDNPPELMSVMTAKGLDLKKVVLFGFGETLFSEGLPQIQIEDSEYTNDIGKAYAFNQLYVAITRSTDELLIMDTEGGHKLLWEQLLDFSLRKKILDGMGKDLATQWEAVLPRVDALPIWDSAMQFAPLRSEELSAQAQNLRKTGMELRRYDFMEKSAAFYRKAGKREDEKKCKAYALWFSESYRKASQEFLTLKMNTEAVECLWEGMKWSDLVALNGLIDQKRAAIAKFMESKLDPVNRVESFLNELDKLQIIPEPPSVPQWLHVVNEIVIVATQLLKNTDAKHYHPGLHFRLSTRLKEFGRIGHPKCLPLAADGFAFSHEWRSARNVLNEIGPYETIKYRDLILCNTEEWPDYIKPCIRTKQDNLLLKRWKKDKQPNSGMSQEEAAHLFRVLKKNEYTKEAISIAFNAVLLKKLWGIKNELSVDELLKLLNVSISKNDDSALNVTNGKANIWSKRHEFRWEQRLKLFEILCSTGDWKLLAKLTKEILDSDPNQVELNWICDVIAHHTDLGHLPESEFNEKIKLPDLILQIAKKIGKSWPTTEIDLQRAAAAMEFFGLDKPLSILGKQYSNSTIKPVQSLARKIYERGRALYTERLSQSGFEKELKAARRETLRQLDVWGIQKAPQVGNRFYPPNRIEIESNTTPFRDLGSEVKELEGFWIVESHPYSIQVPKDKKGFPSGLVEIKRLTGRRPKVLYIDLIDNEIETSSGEIVSLLTKRTMEDPGIKGGLVINNMKMSTEIILQLSPWPDGLKIVFPKKG